MVATTLDTHRIVKRLRSVGFTDEQAETVTDVLREAQDFALAEVVTKADLRAEVTAIRAEIAAVRADLVALEERMSARIESLEQRMTAQIESLEQRMTAKLESLEQRMTIKLGAMLAAAVGLVALLVKLL
jgi:chromosome segregation ATPase